MSSVSVSGIVIPAPGGGKEVQLTFIPEGGAMNIAWRLDAQSARNVAVLILALAAKAESPLIQPGFDSVPPVGA